MNLFCCCLASGIEPRARCVNAQLCPVKKEAENMEKKAKEKEGREEKNDASRVKNVHNSVRTSCAICFW